jgi:hypothetical protein
MLELVFTACSLLQGASCKQVSLTYSMESVSLIQCMTGAQPVIAAWVREHPNWTVAKWSCRPAGLYAKA